ncbi:MarR family winged helix-turn-helix transcriptional regulator [Haliangium ochraceum]|uniref:Transcriptional regulator, MarR family n=1 Tax=Haliangium ochraceum (strain DSM 14365 / JCM 11303 / SMP-2) TaxID=502025 RepID=D0LUV4_HALO1|nr:MarR family transcriptional regulator [Haliangium ochraceum]ACY13994.1 transcriptional regulator, MarR family [Haliangium ochraceum DSM 14365]
MTPSVELLHAISELSDALGEKMSDVVAAGKLTASQFNLLYDLEHEGPMRLGELARFRRCVKSNVSNLVRGMERDGLVELKASPEDRRARVVSPSALGRRRLRAALRVGNQLERGLRDSLGEARAQRLRKLCLDAAAILDE